MNYHVTIDCPQLSRRYERMSVAAVNGEEAIRIGAARALRDSRGRGISPLLAGLSRPEALKTIGRYATVDE
jgi:hypothetical protein